MRFVLGGLALVALALLTSRSVATWQNDVTVWSHAREICPDKPRPALNLSAALIRRQATGDLQFASLIAAEGDRLAQSRSGWEHSHGQLIARRQEQLIQWILGDRKRPLVIE